MSNNFFINTSFYIGLQKIVVNKVIIPSNFYKKNGMKNFIPLKNYFI